jgi:hypothetical protein
VLTSGSEARARWTSPHAITVNLSPENRWWLTVAAVLGVLLVTLGFWVLALGTVDMGGLTGLGLVSVLPLWAYLAFVPVTAAFVFGLARPTPSTLLCAVAIVALVLMLYGAAPMIEGEPRFSPSYRHLGIIDYITRHGTVDPTIDAYQNWPGMFILASAIAGATGLHDLIGAALWAPVWFNLLFLPPLFVLLDSLTDDRRAVWLGIWFFYLTDWIGQDYFSPQAMGFLLFLAATALLVRWLSAREWAEPGDELLPEPTWMSRLPRLPRALLGRMRPVAPARVGSLPPIARAGLVAAYLAIFTFAVSGHQLTPFFMIGSVAALVVLGRVRWVSLPVVMAVVVVAWVAFMAVVFLIGHFQNVAGYVGTLSDSLAANLTGRISGSPDHQLVVYARLAFTALVWLIALAGFARRLLAGRWDVTTAALAIAPFPLFAVQAYGGEMLLRIHLFSLPFMSLLAAFALVPRKADVLSRVVAVVVALTTIGLIGSFMLTRYGNERIESYTHGEIAAVDELYKIAPEGSLLTGVVGNLPWKTTLYEGYRYRPVGSDVYYGELDQMLSDMEAYSGPAYLIITRTQEAYAELILGATPAEWSSFERQIFATGRFEIISSTPDATIARFIPDARSP